MTDRNRITIVVGYTDNLLKAVNLYRNASELFLEGNKKTSRLVYFEEYDNEAVLKNRCAELQRLTKAQKERMIRAVNPDWVDLSLRISSTEIADLNAMNIHLRKTIAY